MSKQDENDEKISFDEHPAANPESRKLNLKRFQMNPERNWGPKMRSKTSTLKQMENSKRIRNQGKNSKKDNSESESDVKKLKVDKWFFSLDFFYFISTSWTSCMSINYCKVLSRFYPLLLILNFANSMYALLPNLLNRHSFTLTKLIESYWHPAFSSADLKWNV